MNPDDERLYLAAQNGGHFCLKCIPVKIPLGKDETGYSCPRCGDYVTFLAMLNDCYYLIEKYEQEYKDRYAT